MRKTILVFFIFLIPSLSLAQSIILSDQATGIRYASNNTFANGLDLNVVIFDSLSGGSIIYNETFSQVISNGSWNIMLGQNSDIPLNLTMGKSYYKEYYILDEKVNITNNTGSIVNRLEFISPIGDFNTTLIDGEISLFSAQNNSNNFTLTQFFNAGINSSSDLFVENRNITAGLDILNAVTNTNLCYLNNTQTLSGQNTFNSTTRVTGADFIVNNTDLYVDAETGNTGIGGAPSSLADVEIFRTDDDPRLRLTFQGNPEQSWELRSGTGTTFLIFNDVSNNFQTFKIQSRTPTNSFVLYNTSLVINDNSNNYTTRIKGDTDADLFFVDATNDRVGVGTEDPTHKLTVVGGVNISADLFVENRNITAGLDILNAVTNTNLCYLNNTQTLTGYNTFSANTSMRGNLSVLEHFIVDGTVFQVNTSDDTACVGCTSTSLAGFTVSKQSGVGGNIVQAWERGPGGQAYGIDLNNNRFSFVDLTNNKYMWRILPGATQALQVGNSNGGNTVTVGAFPLNVIPIGQLAVNGMTVMGNFSFITEGSVSTVHDYGTVIQGNLTVGGGELNLSIAGNNNIRGIVSWYDIYANRTVIANGGLNVSGGEVYFNNTILRTGNVTNGLQDRCTLVSGNCSITNTRVTEGTNIYCSGQQDGGTVGAVRVADRNTGSGYTITSTSGTDTSVVACLLVQ